MLVTNIPRRVAREETAFAATVNSTSRTFITCRTPAKIFPVNLTETTYTLSMSKPTCHLWLPSLIPFANSKQLLRPVFLQTKSSLERLATADPLRCRRRAALGQCALSREADSTQRRPLASALIHRGTSPTPKLIISLLLKRMLKPGMTAHPTPTSWFTEVCSPFFQAM